MNSNCCKVGFKQHFSINWILKWPCPKIVLNEMTSFRPPFEQPYYSWKRKIIFQTIETAFLHFHLVPNGNFLDASLRLLIAFDGRRSFRRVNWSTSGVRSYLCNRWIRGCARASLTNCSRRPTSTSRWSGRCSRTRWWRQRSTSVWTGPTAPNSAKKKLVSTSRDPLN